MEEETSGGGIVAVDVMSSTNYLECDVDGSLFSAEEPPHTGAWSEEEEEYAERLTLEFREGNLDLPDGTSLRQFLAQMLHCNPKRISKHYEGTHYSGGRKFYRRASKKLSELEIRQRQTELNRLRGMYKKRLLRLRMPHMSDDEEEERSSKKAKPHPPGQRLSPDHVPPPVFAPRVSDATFPGNQDAFASLRSPGMPGPAPPPFISRVSGSTLPGTLDQLVGVGASRHTATASSQVFAARANSLTGHPDAFIPLAVPNSAPPFSMLPMIGQHHRQLPNMSDPNASLLMARLPNAAAPTSRFDSRLRALSVLNQLDAETELRASMLRELQLRRMQRQIGNAVSAPASALFSARQQLSRPLSVRAPVPLGATSMTSTPYPWSPLSRVTLPAVPAHGQSPPLSIDQAEALLRMRSNEESKRSTPTPPDRKRKATDLSKR